MPVECTFPPGINYKTFEYKWKGEAKNPWVKVDDTEISKRIQEMTKNMYLAMDGEGAQPPLSTCSVERVHVVRIRLHLQQTLCQLLALANWGCRLRTNGYSNG